MPITPFPGPVPSTGDPANFNTRADATLGHLPTFVTEANQLAVDLNLTSANAADNAATAVSAANAAAQSVTDAAAAAGAVKWVSGTTYAQGVVVWSPANFLNYRRMVAGSGTTDPSSDPAKWALMGAPLAAPIVPITTNTSAAPGIHYQIMSALTLTLPASPQIRDTVQFTNCTGLTTSIINPNGKLIRGTSGNMLLNVPHASATLIYSGASKGWL